MIRGGAGASAECGSSVIEPRRGLPPDSPLASVASVGEADFT
jgi:hypothetical protein